MNRCLTCACAGRERPLSIYPNSGGSAKGGVHLGDVCPPPLSHPPPAQGIVAHGNVHRPLDFRSTRTAQHTPRLKVGFCHLGSV
jgi:hypothetical protein